MIQCPLWSELYCKTHQQKIEYVDVSIGNQVNRVFCHDRRCNRPINAINFDQTYNITSRNINLYDEQINQIRKIKKLEEQLIEKYQIIIQSHRKMINKIDNISIDNGRIQDELQKNITSLDQLQKFCQLLAESEQKFQQQSELQYISECLQFLIGQEQSTIIPVQEQIQEQKNILDSQILLNTNLFKKEELDESQLINYSVYQPQQNNLLCPKHQEEIKLISLNQTDKQRAICYQCLGGERRMTCQIDRVFQDHKREYYKIFNQILIGEDFFYSLIKKSFLQIINILNQILANFNEKLIQLDGIWLHIQKLLHEDDQIFNIQNYQQLEEFAKLHFQVFERYYCNFENFQSQLNYEKEFENSFYEKILPQNESVQKISEDIIAQIQQLFIQFQQSLNFMQKTIQSKLMQRQVQNSIISNFQSTQVIKKVVFDEQNLHFVILQNKTVILFEMENGQFIQKTQLNFNCCLKDICFQNQCKWLVTGSDSVSSELKFWGVQKLSGGRVEFQIEYQCQVSEILQLEIDEKNDNCISFHKNEIIIWKKNNNWEEIKKISPIVNILSAQFDSASNHLAILFINTLQVIVCLQNEFLDQKRKCFEFQLSGIQNQLIKKFQFYSKKPTKQDFQYLLIHYDDTLLLIQLDLKSKLVVILKKFPFQQQLINIMKYNNSILIIDKDNEVLSLYAVDQNVSNDEEFNLTLLTQIVSSKRLLYSNLSFNGIFLASVSQIDDQFVLKIYSIIRMPHLNKIPTRQLNVVFSGF